MRRLLACSCLTPILFIPMAAKAETTIATAITTGVATSTASNGAPDDVRVTSAGSIKPTSGAALTLDSANSATNEGTISFTDVSNATGILATSSSGTIANSGTISIAETYAPTDTDSDTDLDGPFSKQSGNAAIRVTGPFTGNVTNSGTITVKGNDSAGIVLGGPLTGNLSNSGAITVVGDNSVGIRTGDVTGSIKVLGAVSAQGQDAVAVDIDGAIGGALVIQNTITSTGYRYTTVPSDTSKLDADDLLQGGSALRVSGSVAGGILFDIPPTDTDTSDTDEDDDGIADSSEGTATVVSYGAAPAVLIGSASDAVSIGPVAGNADGFGIVIKGSVIGSGQYSGVSGTGIQIGGLGGTVSVAGGVAISGTVSGKSADANATALKIGAGASVPKLLVSGTLSAANGGAATTEAVALHIDSGASLPTITNTGTISANASSKGIATVIRDRSDTVTLIDNSGAISATSQNSDAGSVVAIDLRGNSVGATVRQNLVAATATAPRIIGDILLGSGDDILDAADGTITGAVSFGAGNNQLRLSGDTVLTGNVSFDAGADSVALAGTTALNGALDFGGGADTLSLSDTASFTGSLTNSGGLALTMTGGKLNLANTSVVALSSLNVSGDSTIGVTIDPTAHSATQYQAGTASFGEGVKVSVSVASVGSAEGDYVIVKAGSLTGGGNLATTDTSLPYMFKGTLSADDAAGQVSLSIDRKSVAELGLSRSQAAAYDAVFNALDKDAAVADVFLGIRDQATFQDAVQQMLPEHAGGIFETVTRGSRTLGSYIANPDAMVAKLAETGIGFWLQQAAWGTSKSRGDTAGYRSSGWGASGGVELESGIGKLGGSLSYMNGKEEQRRIDQDVTADQYEAAVHWRNSWGGFNAFTRASAALVHLSGSRRFEGLDGTTEVSRNATSTWNGQLYSLAGGISYRFETGRLTIRPGATIDYYRLHEGKHTETGGGDAFNLTVAARTSDELAATGTVALGYALHKSDTGFTRIELEGGRREIVGGSLGATVANFAGGESFTLLPEKREAGWLGSFRLVGGSEFFRASAEASAQEQNGRAALGFRATVSVGF